MLNTYEELRSRPGTWMVAGFLPHIDPAIAKYPKEGGNSASVRNVELMAACSECLFQGWNKTYSDPVPTEFADAQTTLMHVVAEALSISDQKEADKLLGDPLSCKYIIITCFLHSVCMQILTSFFPSSWVPDSQLLKLCNYHVIDK